MPHDHGHHGHHHLDSDAGDRRVAIAVAVNLVLTFAQIVGGLISGSVALIADAVHNFSDAVSLIVAYGARRIARRPATPEMSFGYGRAEVVAALVNYTTLIIIALWLGFEAVMRLIDPPPVTGWIVVLLAGIALVIDLVTAALTWRLSKESVNIRAAFLHNLADAGSSVAVIIGGTLILLYDWRLVDPIITLLISAYILWHAASEVGPVIRVLMLAAPDGTRAAAIRARMEKVEGVEDVHHLHLWQIDERSASVEAHIVVAEGHEAPTVVADVKRALAGDFGLTHVTLETETRASGCSSAACAA
ncbi:cation diffusion facilitator family transporter [Ostreiculturibacter nitratireducens]|uniref:cation diffusion facilitator family transporter n=1 Tax=Ostreiculturibacter nitratireducens TaxID=3075226 RepID=UPI0031B5A397